MTLVRIGRLGRAHGLRGEVVLEGTALTTRELGQVGSFTWRGASGETRSLTLEGVRPATGSMLVRFAGIGDRDQAAALTRGVLFAERERLPDPGPGVAYTFQLIGLEVVTEAGRRLGVLETILESGAHPIYVVRGDKELLIPATPQVVRNVDLDSRRITVTLPAGLEDL
ncbi:MAG TPA: ribosome maturation factor RimM [Candidatus Eisenbacteria bacterium]|jgi:16S rRNA processing protein RimM